MISPINNPLSVSALETVSGRKQATEAAAVLYDVGKRVPPETGSAAPNGRADGAAYFGDTRGLTGTELRFRVSDNLAHIVVVVVERNTGDIIREISVKEPFLSRARLDAIQSGPGIDVFA